MQLGVWLGEIECAIDFFGAYIVQLSVFFNSNIFACDLGAFG